MKEKQRLERVTRTHRCPICQHDSWCLANSETAICMRVAGPKEYVFKDKSVGWLHRLDGVVYQPPPPQPRREQPVINVMDLLEAWHGNLRAPSLSLLADNLRVSVESLRALGCVWADTHMAWAFPMRDGDGRPVGIRLRSTSGYKWAVAGSKQGLFSPPVCNSSQLVVCEGPTDTAAALTIGLYAVGRPSCSGCIEAVRVLVRQQKVKSVVIVADNDEPGLRGATQLAEHIMAPSAILVLPCKDMREFVKLGGDKPTFQALLSQLVWNKRKDT